MAVSLRVAVGRRIRELRKARGWTQEELGSRCKLDYKYVGAIERGERNFPIDALEKVARGLKVEPRSLFFEAVEPAGRDAPDSDYTPARVQDLLTNSDPSTLRLLLAVCEDIVRYRAGA